MKKRLKIILMLTVLLAASINLRAQNPYLPLWEFIPDGEPHVFEDPDQPGKYRVYIYGSHDILRTTFCGQNHVVWSAPVEDLSRWRYDGIIFECLKDRDGNDMNPDGSGDVLHAPDVALLTGPDGKKTYYLYPNDIQQGPKLLGLIAKSSRPDGPFEVCNWSSDDPKGVYGIMGYDPAVLVDDDGRVYGYWGSNRSYAAELDPKTMCTVKEGTKIVEDMIPGHEQDRTFRFFEASSIRKIKDKYVFIYSRCTNEGEFGLPLSNYTLAYCYSNSPLGPWTYGGTLIDGRGLESRPDGTRFPTATPNGNTHGSICEIKGKWWVFYHRQTTDSSFARQPMVAPIEVDVVEGPTGYVHISEAEYTSEGFRTEGLDPLTKTPAGLACYFTGPKPSYEKWPRVYYSGSYIGSVRDQWDGQQDPYSPECNRCYMVNNISGSVVGYKYFDFSRTFGARKLHLLMNVVPEGPSGTVDVYIDRPSVETGGVKIAKLNVPAGETGPVGLKADISALRHFNGKHALFFVFSSPVEEKSICRFDDFVITLY